jgi:hypothetical protein
MVGPASLIEDRKAVLETGTIIQIRIWLLPRATDERPHRLKYSLFYGRPGERIVGYDNEAGNYRDREEPYTLTSLEQLVADFEADVRKEIANE